MFLHRIKMILYIEKRQYKINSRTDIKIHRSSVINLILVSHWKLHLLRRLIKSEWKETEKIEYDMSDSTKFNLPARNIYQFNEYLQLKDKYTSRDLGDIKLATNLEFEQ